MNLRVLQVIGITAILLMACNKAEEPAAKNANADSVAVQPVTVVTVAPQRFEHMLDVKGSVESRSSVIVSAKTGGQIMRLNVSNGQAVTKGQVLAELDAEITRRGMAQVQTQLEFARTMAEKQKRIYEAKAGSEVQYLQAKTQLEALERQMDQMQEQLDMARIVAPTSGFVDGLTPHLGENIAPGMPLMTIVNTSDLRVAVDLSESYVATVNTGDKVTIIFPELADTLRTKANVVSKNVNPVSRTFRVEIPVQGIANVRPNLTCNVQINDITIESALAVPIEAVLQDGDTRYVFVCNDKNTVSRKTVTTGLVSGGLVQLTSGIQTGEHVVVRGALDIAEGQRVRITQ